ncbi:hypothetical protein [Bradyrhizobium sp. C9]|uniref:hypothetical protein n=1 Tax=Bradyrhizobium sp. C9 TaxID=142585 RepID=UPI00130462A9|nr:hypothetical protein [Bradyrhizobium sp. C9]
MLLLMMAVGLSSTRIAASNHSAHKNVSGVLLLLKPHLWDFAMSDAAPFIGNP